MKNNNSEKLYVYFWNRMGRKGQYCRVIARGKMNSCWVRFEDGFEAITSRNALRTIKDKSSFSTE